MSNDDHSAGSGSSNKFEPDGTARHFPGNTIISFVPAHSVEAELLTRAVEQLSDALALDFVLLPPSSWHMTVFELLCDNVRDAAHWSRLLETTAALTATDEFFAERVPTVTPPAQFDMRYRSISVGEHTVGLQLEPANADTANELRRYRDDVSAATGVRFPDHDRYRFHITLGYRLTAPTPATQRAVDAAMSSAHLELDNTSFAIGQPVLTYFSDMTDFAVDTRPDRATPPPTT